MQFKPFAEKILESLDQKPSDYSYVAVPQLSNQNVKILINANPLDKIKFTEFWMKLPLSQHRIQNLDYHIIPGLDIATMVISGKARFDESGKNRMDQSADLVPIEGPSRAIWGSFFGFTIILLVDVKSEIIGSFDYKITHIPGDSVISV